MEPARPLRDVLAGLTDPDPDGAPTDARAELAAAGHGDLPDDLIVTAIAGYAGTAPAEVGRHLAPFLGAPDAATGLDLLTTAPVGPFDGEVPLHDTGDPDDLDGTSGLLGTADDLDAVDGVPHDAPDPAAPDDLGDLGVVTFGDTGGPGPDDDPWGPDVPAGDVPPADVHDASAADTAADLFDGPGSGPLEQVPVDDEGAEDLDDLDGLDG